MWPQPRDSRVCWEDPSASGCQAVGPAAGDTRPRVPLSCPVASGQSSKQKPLCCGGSGHSRARQAGNKGPAGPGVLSGSVKCRTCALYTRGGWGARAGDRLQGRACPPQTGAQAVGRTYLYRLPGQRASRSPRTPGRERRVRGRGTPGGGRGQAGARGHTRHPPG